MDKNRLATIIQKDLDELKILTDEVADNDDNSSLIIDLALNKARLLIQEFELMREINGNTEIIYDDPENENDDESKDNDSDMYYPDPELEIIHFHKDKPIDTDESDEVDEEDDDLEINEEEDEEDDSQQDEGEIIGFDEDSIARDENLEETTIISEEDEEDSEDPVTDKSEEPSKEFEDDDEEDRDSFTNYQQEPIGITDDHDQVTSIPLREIHIEDLDDEDETEAVEFSTLPGSATRPVMREIPKPETITSEKQVVGDTFQKERSINDTIGKNIANESKLNNGPIANLRTAIGLNDRFIFIREIFGNNTDKYNTVIEKLDSLETIQQAVEYLKANLQMEKNETTIKFVDLLKRRFTK